MAHKVSQKHYDGHFVIKKMLPHNPKRQSQKSEQQKRPTKNAQSIKHKKISNPIYVMALGLKRQNRKDDK